MIFPLIYSALHCPIFYRSHTCLLLWLPFCIKFQHAAVLFVTLGARKITPECEKGLCEGFTKRGFQFKREHVNQLKVKQNYDFCDRSLHSYVLHCNITESTVPGIFNAMCLFPEYRAVSDLALFPNLCSSVEISELMSMFDHYLRDQCFLLKWCYCE